MLPARATPHAMGAQRQQQWPSQPRQIAAACWRQLTRWSQQTERACVQRWRVVVHGSSCFERIRIQRCDAGVRAGPRRSDHNETNCNTRTKDIARRTDVRRGSARGTQPRQQRQMRKRREWRTRRRRLKWHRSILRRCQKQGGHRLPWPRGTGPEEGGKEEGLYKSTHKHQNACKPGGDEG
jgi:hypothetical protein